MTQPVFTIGHSTHSIEEMIALLQAQRVTWLADVRTVPRSRRNPQFNQETLPEALAEAGIGYSHMPALGGFRKPQPGSVNTAWRNESFQGYADYMQTPDFRQALGSLVELAQQQRVALMCAEAVPWRCHRSLIGDALQVRGIEVQNIFGTGNTKPHSLTSFARVVGEEITYPAEAES